MKKKPKRGRPFFKVTRANRNVVEQLLAVGEKQELIAATIGCSVVTLRAKFGEELKFGAARRRAEVLSMLYRAARTGNVAAIKRLDELMHLSASEGALPKPKPLGKKAQAQLDAEMAGEGTSWADLLKPPDPPRQLSVNLPDLA
jgi:hypothetical protein